MISYACPLCKTENTLEANFQVTEYVCKSCNNLISTENNKTRGVLKQSASNVVLKVGDKGVLDGKNFTVVAIVVKKYGSSTFWREYYLKDQSGNSAFLSESDGHWVLMYPKENPLKDFKYYSDFEGKKYRWYETTPNNVAAASGFFEDKLELKLSNYKEFVNGTEMVSWEETGNKRQFFWGKHIPKGKVRRAFKPSYMPNYYGIGIVQPFYYNVKHMVNILGVAALLISLMQLYVHISRANYPVFEEQINFSDAKDKELVSKSFELKGGSAPLKVKINSQVDNSWANTEISLVNESTNEITSTSQDIEYYHGVSDGESWSEGSTSKEINFCGVAPGKYHFLISAEKEQGALVYPTSQTEISGRTVTVRPDGLVEVRDAVTGNLTTYGDMSTYKKDSLNFAEFEKVKKKQDSINGLSNLPLNTEPTVAEINPENQNISLKATWLPVSLWNYGIIMAAMAVFVALSYWGKYAFEKSKWSNSSNSPYPESEE